MQPSIPPFLIALFLHFQSTIQEEVQDSDDFIRDEANSGPKEGQIRLVNGREESEVIGERVKNFSV